MTGARPAIDGRGLPSAGSAAEGRRGSIVGPAIRTWLRYLGPLTALSALALAPQLVIALRAPVPVDAARATIALRIGWAIVATSWLSQLVLVGAAAAMLRLPPARRTQRRALAAGLVQLLRSVVPCAIAAAAIVLGSLAFVVPGLILLVLLSLTAAAPDPAAPAALRDSLAVARRGFVPVAVAIAAILALDAALGLLAYRACVVPLGKLPAPAQLAAARGFVRVVALGLVVISPLPASLLATIRGQAR